MCRMLGVMRAGAGTWKHQGDRRTLLQASPEGVEIMSVIGEIRVSLDAIGYEQQAYLFAFLTSYPLAIGGLLEPRGRRYAGWIAAAAVLGFVIETDPWINGVFLMVFFIGAMGLFIASVCALDQLPRLLLRSRLVPIPVQAELPLMPSDAPREREGLRPHPLPVRGHGTT